MASLKDLITNKTLNKVNRLGNTQLNKINKQKAAWNYHRPSFIGEIKNPTAEVDKKRLEELKRLKKKIYRETNKAKAGVALTAATGLGVGVGAGMGAYEGTKKAVEQTKTASVQKFFKRLGELYSGSKHRKINKVRESVGKSMTEAPQSNTPQSVVDSFNKKYNKLRKARAAETAKRTGLHGMTGLAGATGYHGYIKDKKAK